MKTYTHKCDEISSGVRLDKFISAKLSFLSRTKARLLIREGGVYLNRKRCKVESRIVRAGDRVDIHYKEKNLNSDRGGTDSFTITKEIILYEDDDLIVLNKPAGIPSQATLDSSRSNIFDALKKYLSIPSLAIHHRLDKDTTGIMLFTKTKKWNKEITDSFREKKAQKEYLAIVEGIFPKEKNLIEKRIAERPNKHHQYLCVEKGGRSATTELNLLETSTWESKSISLLLVKPKTGRTHQIRTHLSSAGFPVLGDTLYGATYGFSDIRLHAYRLYILGKIFVAPVPSSFLKLFPASIV